MRNKTQERGNLHLFEIRWYRGSAALIEGRYLIEANDSGRYSSGVFLLLSEVIMRKELEKNIGLKGKDFYQDTNNKKQLLLQGYQWNLI